MNVVFSETKNANGLISELNEVSLAGLCPHLEPVALEFRQILHETDRPLTHAYFVESGLISSVRRMQDGGTVEVGLVGREGMSGLPALLGEATAPDTGVVQMAGRANRVEIGVLRDLMGEDAALRATLLRYARGVIVQAGQLAACNRLHNVEARLARWLLMARDRAATDELPLTQEFLAIMLGVRRAGVTVAMNALAGSGLVRNARRRITVIDSEGLEATACECYRVIQRAFAPL
ncbi:MAG: Crp/Fnr family transcriptional regulator [Acidisphaera sp.]|nr:Crp/Fnr family transcriptional regulator [Acidisphaera sp.]